MKYLVKKDIIKSSWEKWIENSQNLITVGIILLFTNHLIPSLVDEFILHDYNAQFFLFHLVYLFITTGLMLGMMGISLDLINNNDFTPHDIISKFDYVIYYLAGSLIMISVYIVSLMPVVFIIALILGDINAIISLINGEALGNMGVVFILFLAYIILITYTAIKVHFFGYIMLDMQKGPLMSIKESIRLTSGYEADLFLLWCFLFLLNILGSMLFFIGLIFTVPFTFLILSFVFKKMKKNNYQSTV